MLDGSIFEAKKAMNKSLKIRNPKSPKNPIRQVRLIKPRNVGKLEKKAFVPRFIPFRFPAACIEKDIDIRKGRTNSKRITKDGIKLYRKKNNPSMVNKEAKLSMPAFVLFFIVNTPGILLGACSSSLIIFMKTYQRQIIIERINKTGPSDS